MDIEVWEIVAIIVIFFGATYRRMNKLDKEAGSKTSRAVKRENLRIVSENTLKYKQDVDKIFDNIIEFYNKPLKTELNFQMSHKVKRHFDLVKNIRPESYSKLEASLAKGEVEIVNVESTSEGYKITAVLSGAGYIMTKLEKGSYKGAGLEFVQIYMTALVRGKRTFAINCPRCGGIIDKNSNCVYCRYNMEVKEGLEVTAVWVPKDGRCN